MRSSSMSSRRNVVLLACGSFNPPTHMHLRMFEVARDFLHRMERCTVVAGLISPVHDGYGKKDLVCSKHRCALVKLAVADSDWLRLSDWESQHQNQWTPTRHVLQHHQQVLDNVLSCRDDVKPAGGNPVLPEWADVIRHRIGPVQVRLLCGADLLESFGRPGLWHDDDLKEIVCQHGPVVITRVGSDAERFIHSSDLLTRFQSRIDLVTEWVANEISSSRIRLALSRGESVKYLLPQPVLEYLYQHQLYNTSRVERWCSRGESEVTQQNGAVSPAISSSLSVD